MVNAVNMSFRVDKDLKKQADTLFKDLGLNTSVVINMFLSQCVRELALPFTSNMNKPSKKLKKVLKEAEDIESGKTKAKGYHNIDIFIDDMTR